MSKIMYWYQSEDEEGKFVNVNELSIKPSIYYINIQEIKRNIDISEDLYIQLTYKDPEEETNKEGENGKKKEEWRIEYANRIINHLNKAIMFSNVITGGEIEVHLNVNKEEYLIQVNNAFKTARIALKKAYEKCNTDNITYNRTEKLNPIENTKNGLELTIAIEEIFVSEKADKFSENDLLIMSRVKCETLASTSEKITRLHYYYPNVPRGKMSDLLHEKAFCKKLSPEEKQLEFQFLIADLDYFNSGTVKTYIEVIREAAKKAADYFPLAKVIEHATNIGDMIADVSHGWKNVDKILEITTQFELRIPISTAYLYGKNFLFEGTYVVTNKDVDPNDYKFKNGEFLKQGGAAVKDLSYVIFTVEKSTTGVVSAPPILGYMYGDFLNRIFDQIHSSLDKDKEAHQIKENIVDQVSKGFESMWKVIALKTVMHLKEKITTLEEQVDLLPDDSEILNDLTKKLTDYKKRFSEFKENLVDFASLIE